MTSKNIRLIPFAKRRPGRCAAMLAAALFSAAAVTATAHHDGTHLWANAAAGADTISVSTAIGSPSAPDCCPATVSIALTGGAAGMKWSTRADADSAIYKMYGARDADTLCAECFASEPDRAVCLRISAPAGRPFGATVSLGAPSRHNTKASARQLIMTGHRATPQRGTTRFCYMLKAAADSAAAISASGGSLIVAGATQLTLYVVGEAAADGSGTPYIERCADDAWHLVNYTYLQLRQRHTSAATNTQKHAKRKHKPACIAPKRP